MRESCINHAPRVRSVVIKSDYLEICENDHCEAALLSLVEFWANGAIANHSDRPRKVELGVFTSKQLHWWLLGFYSTKRIMQRIDSLKQRNFIDFEEAANHKNRRYWAHVDIIQNALDSSRQMSVDKSLEEDYSRQMSQDTPDKCLDKTDLLQTNVSTSIFSNSSLSKEELVPPTPVKENEPANGDSGSKEPTPQPLEEKNVVAQLSNNKSLGERNSSSESNSALLARDNNTKRPTRNRDGDAHFGKVKQDNYQRSLAAKIQQQPIVPIEEMQPWGNPETFQKFEAHLLEEAKKWKGCENPAGIVASKLQAIASGKAAKTEFKEWQSKQEAKTKASQAPTQPDRPPLTPEQEAWIAVTSEVHRVIEDEFWVSVAPRSGVWIVTSNVGSWSGRLDEVVARIPLQSLPTRFPSWYPECYRLALKKFPHLSLPAPATRKDRAS